VDLAAPALPETTSVVFSTATEKLAKLFPVDPSHQRLDSTQIFSNMRHLGRIGLFVRVTLLVNLKRHHLELFDALPGERTEKYLRKSSESVFPMVKPSTSGKTLFWATICSFSHAASGKRRRSPR